MRLEQLSFFVEVCRSRSISLAASRVFMSQQNISTSIRKLEQELGFELFERTHHGVNLTPQGEEVLAKAEEILKAVNDLKKIGSSKEQQLTGELRVALVPYIALPEMIVDFYRQNPATSIKTTEKSPGEVIDDLNNGLADVGFIYLRMEEELLTPELEQVKLSKDKVYLCISKKLNYPRRQYSISEVLEMKLPLIVFDSLYDWTMEALDMLEEQKPLVYQAGIQVYKRMVLAGLAAGLATKTGLEQEIVFQKGDVDALRLEGYYLVVCMLYKKNPTSPLKEEFLSTILEKFREMSTD